MAHRPRPLSWRTDISFTADGLADKKKELERLETLRIEALKELNFAREQGDRSENGAYKAARWKLSQTDRLLRDLRSVLRRAVVIEKPTDGTVGIGSVVTVQVEGMSKPVEYMIVAAEESNLMEQKLSQYSPLGKALLYKRAGDTVTYHTPNGTMQGSIVEVK